MIKRVIALVALLVLVAPGISSIQAAAPVAKHRPIISRIGHPGVGSSGVITGTLAALSGITMPASLTLTTAHGAVTVTFASSTAPIVRRYNGKSALDELSLGDTLAARGRDEWHHVHRYGPQRSLHSGSVHPRCRAGHGRERHRVHG